MGCALTEPDNYPDYIKDILKEIASKDDENLKGCACTLISPTSDEGCVIVDEDKKVGVFPFCSTLVEDGVGDDTDYPLKLTLKQAMNLYWRTTNWNFKAQSNSSRTGGVTWLYNFTQKERVSVNLNDKVGPPPPSKNLACFNYFQYISNYNGLHCGMDGCQPVDGSFIAATMLEGLSATMKHKKEGDIYYFYPLFRIAFGNYAVCAAQTQIAAEECVSAFLGTKDGGSITVTPKILKESCFPLKLYVKIFADSESDSYNGSASISTLEFIE